jgi:RHS repeat-associated protein
VLPQSGGPCYGVTVTPDNISTAGRTTNTAGYYTETFWVANFGTESDTYALTCHGITNLSCTSLSQNQVTLAGGTQTTIVAHYNTGSRGIGTLSLTAVGSGVSDSGYYTVPVGAPIVDTLAFSQTKQDFGRCAQACFAATYAQGTVPYFSLDAPRNVTLAYNGSRFKPKPFILVNVTADPSGVPSEYRLQVKVNGALVTFLNGEQTLRFNPGTGTVRLGGQFDATTYATGAYAMDIIVSGLYGTTLLANDVVTKLVVVNETNNPIAGGWTLAGVQRAYTTSGGVLITEGDGSAVLFTAVGSTYTAPAGEFSTLVSGTPYGAGWTRRFPDSTKVLFDATGKMIEVRDRFVNKTTITYDASSRIWKITDPQALVTTLVYGANGLSTITGAGSPVRVTNVTVDASKRLTAIQDPDNVSTTFGYDGILRLNAITNRNGKTTTLAYDPNFGTLATVTAPAVAIYGQQNPVSPVTTLGAWQKVSVPSGATSGTPFTPVLADSVKASVTEPGAAITRFTVNRWGSPARTTDPLGHLTTVVYDANGLPTSVLYASGGKDTTAYNASGLPVYVKSQGDSATSLRYAGWARVDSVWGTGRRAERYFIGAIGKVDSMRIAGGAPGGAIVTKYTYDALGRLIKTTDPEGHLLGQTWFLGANGNRSRDSLSGNRVTTRLYDAYGRDTAIQAPQSGLVRTHYDVLNRPTQVYNGVYPNPIVTAYDSLYVRSVTDYKGQVYGFTHNALGWVTQRTDPAGRSQLYAYSLDGDLKRWTNRRGDSLLYAYDALHRPTSKTGSHSAAESWSYSTDGRSGKSVSPVATDSVFLSILGRPDSLKTFMAGQTYRRLYHYTPAGQLDSVGITGGGIAFLSRRYVYNAAQGTLTGIKLAGAETDFSLNRDFQPATVTFPGGEQVNQQFYSLHGMAHVSTLASYAGDVAFSVLFDSLGRITRQVDGSGTSGLAYFYNGLGRLVADTNINAPFAPPGCEGTTTNPPPLITDQGDLCVVNGTWQVGAGRAYAYDSVGNRKDQGGTYLTGNRISAFAACTYATDNDGNVTTRTCGAQTDNFYWSAESRLDSMTVVGKRVGFRYDAAGHLVRKDTTGVIERYFLWDGGNLLAELNATGTGKVAEYSYNGMDNLHALIVGGSKYYAHSDALGNVIALTDSVQFTKRFYDYDAWGKAAGGSDILPFNNADRARWKGALWMGPEDDIYYMRNRWYDPKSGRFLSEDPIGLGGGLNSYTFAAEDPIDHNDPMGTCPSGSQLNMTLDEESGTWTATCVSTYGDGGGAPGSMRGADYAGAFGMPNAISGGWDLSGMANSWGFAVGHLVGPLARQSDDWKRCEPTGIAFTTERSQDINGIDGIWLLKRVKIIDYFKFAGVRTPIPGGVGVYTGILVPSHREGRRPPTMPGSTGFMQANGLVLCAAGYGIFEATPNEVSP